MMTFESLTQVSPLSPPLPAAPPAPVSPAASAPGASSARSPPLPAVHTETLGFTSSEVRMPNLCKSSHYSACGRSFRSASSGWSLSCITHPVGFDETDKDGEEDGWWHCLRALSKKLHHIFKSILDLVQAHTRTHTSSQK